MARVTEKDYLEIAKRAVHRPAKVKNYRSFLIYGRNKKGKTRFSVSAGIPTTLVLDPERGTDTMKTLNPYVWPISKWEDTNDAYYALRTGKLSPFTLDMGPEKEPFTWVSVDGLTRINNMAVKYVGRVEEERNLDRQPGMVDRRDYFKSGELMKQLLINFANLRMNVCYTAQEKMMTIEDGPDDEEAAAFFVPDLPNAVKQAVNASVEVIGRIHTVRTEVKGTEVTQRRLQIGIHEKYDTGYRSDFKLPDMIKNPTIPKLVNLMLTGEAA